MPDRTFLIDAASSEDMCVVTHPPAGTNLPRLRTHTDHQRSLSAATLAGGR
jgi:hypothetical protein